MENKIIQNSGIKTAVPLCPVFGECGGCAYQDIPYEEECRIKERQLKELLGEALTIQDGVFDSILSSPKEYFYRNRLDVSFRRTKDGRYLMGFKPEKRKRTVEIESCPIAMREISDFLPELKVKAIEKFPENYRIANLVIKTGDDGRVFWGGIGRRSLELKPKDYLWTKINGKKIFYSLDTFFQANLSILPGVFRKIESLNLLDPNTLFLDLYSGVGLFGIGFSEQVGKVVMVEESTTSLKAARYNIAQHQLEQKAAVHEGKVEEFLPDLLKAEGFSRKVALVDPPRKGLTPSARQTLIDSRALDAILYLSCNPKALAHDLKVFEGSGWKIERIMPFDFFPRTIHLETLVLLRPEK